MSAPCRSSLAQTPPSSGPAGPKALAAVGVGGTPITIRCQPVRGGAPSKPRLRMRAVERGRVGARACAPTTALHPARPPPARQTHAHMSEAPASAWRTRLDACGALHSPTGCVWCCACARAAAPARRPKERMANEDMVVAGQRHTGCNVRLPLHHPDDGVRVVSQKYRVMITHYLPRLALQTFRVPKSDQEATEPGSRQA